MITHIDMLGACVVLMIVSQRDGQLVVREECHRVCEQFEDLSKEASEPKPLLHAMSCCHVLTFCGGQGDDFLLL